MLKTPLTVSIVVGAGILLAGAHLSQAKDNARHDQQSTLPNLFPFLNRFGILETFNKIGDGTIDLQGAFFQPLGTNGRSCFSCHRPDQGWGISADGMKILFDATQGTDPVFNTVDGSNCGTAIDTSTVDGRRQAYSLLTSRALVRTSIAVPKPISSGGTAEFAVTNINNPYATTGDPFCGHADAASALGGDLQLYRRPIPTTNLLYISAVQWDGRDTKTKIVFPPTNVPSCPVGVPTNLCIPQPDGTVNLIWPGTLLADLNGTTVTATTKRLGGTIALSDPRVAEISNLETNIFTAQAVDFGAGALDSHGASGGPQALSSFPFYIGINDPFPGGNPLGTPFTSTIFTLYDSWAKSGANGADRRAAIVRGQDVFNNTVINITGVAGINDVLGVTTFQGACGTCHDTPGVGDHSVSAPLNIGIANPPATNVLDSTYLPVYTLQNVNPSSPHFGAQIQTTDPGRALITGKWADIGKFKGPILRGLASRAPYFHNGLAQSLDDVVNFYNGRFNIGFTQQQHDDLVAFLSSL